MPSYETQPLDNLIRKIKVGRDKQGRKIYRYQPTKQSQDKFDGYNDGDFLPKELEGKAISMRKSRHFANSVKTYANSFNTSYAEARSVMSEVNEKRKRLDELRRKTEPTEEELQELERLDNQIRERFDS